MDGCATLAAKFTVHLCYHDGIRRLAQVLLDSKDHKLRDRAQPTTSPYREVVGKQSP